MSEVYFDDEGNPTAADCMSPDKVMMDAEEPPIERATPSTLVIMEKVAATFTHGDPTITKLAWRFLLGVEPESMRRCAARAGISFAAISRRARIISEELGMRPRNPQVRNMRREKALASWLKRKRRAGAADPPLLMDHGTTEAPDQGDSYE